MIWNAMMIFGILFIINGIVIMMHSKLLENVRREMPEDVIIYSGTNKGLLFLVSTDVMLGVAKNGIVKKAFSIQSGWLRKSKSEELSILEGLKIKSLSSVEEMLTFSQQKACQMAVKRYNLFCKH